MKTLLFVDDEKTVLSLLVEYFSSRGYDTDIAHDGMEALARVREGELGAVFLALKMPGMDGVEALRLIREIDAELPVVVVTGHATEDLARSLLKAGAFDYVSKPVVLDRLGEIVKQLELIEEARTG